MAPLRPLSLDQLTVVGARPAELVELAARAGFAAISPFIGVVPYEILPAAHLRAGDPETVAMVQRMRETGIVINQADGFAIVDEAPMEAFRESILLMAELGARNIIALHFDSDEERGLDRFCQLDAWAQEAGIGIALEFTRISRIGSLAAALAFLKRVDSANAGILVDLLHLSRAGETPEDLRRVPARLIRGAQLCDAPAILDEAGYQRSSIIHRLWPGEGDLPVTDFIRALPADIIIGMEVPREGPEKTLDERAGRAMETGAVALREAAEPR